MLSRYATAITLVAALTIPTALSTAAPNKAAALAKRMMARKNSEHTHHGVVESVAGGKNGGSITIKSHHHHSSKKKGTKSKTPKPNGGKSETFAVGPHTRVEKHGKPASLADVHKGEHVVIHSRGKVAEKIEIVHHKHKKKKKQKAA